MDTQKGQKVYASVPASYLGMPLFNGVTIVPATVVLTTDDSCIVEFDVQIEHNVKSMLVQVYIESIFKNMKEAIEYIHRKYELDTRPTASNRENQDLERP